MKHLSPFLISLLIFSTSSRCVFKVHDDGQPEKVDTEPYMVSGLTQCLQYNNKLGCCDINNDNAQAPNYIQIDSIFGSQGDGCDICAINLKRFWCEYSCSPFQDRFMKATEEFYPVPDPQKPGATIMAQKVNLTVHSETACDLFNSCKRVGFVSSVSAMSSPAGFLTFQGHNAVDQSFQLIEVDFSYDKNKSLSFDDQAKETEPERQRLQGCNFTTSNQTVHGFSFLKNCTCNNCEDSCNSDNGFVYSESGLFEGFNVPLVVSVWGGSLAIAAIVTFLRNKKEKQKNM